MTTNDTSQQLLLVLTISPTLEEPVTDWLLERQGDTGFSSHAVNGHSSRHGHLSIAEQVSGRQRRVQFQVQLDAGRLEAFLAELGADFSATDLHYWVVPVLAGGHLGV